jgi:ubiquinone/menaquinone biosynthesis C-methylase UbiE
MGGDDGERGFWERHARDYDRSMILLGRPMPAMVRLAAEAVRGAGRVLEVAAGTGLVTTALARSAREVVATDYAAAMVARVEARVRGEGLSNVRCERADLYAPPFEPGTFDAVVAANVLHLVPDVEAAIAALRRVAKPGCLLVAPTFCHDQTAVSRLVSRVVAVTGFPGHRRFTVASLRSVLEASGVVVGRTETLPGLIPIGHVEGTFA